MLPLDENQVIAGLCAQLVARGFVIEQQLHTPQKGVDVIARDPDGVRHYIEAKGATSSRVGSAGHGRPFGSPDTRINIAEAFYTAGVVAGRDELGVRPGVAFHDDALHRRFVEPLLPALRSLGIDLYWVTAATTPAG